MFATLTSIRPQPPKRGRPSKSQPEQQAARTSPSTKRAKRKTTSQGPDHTAHSDAEILEAFRLFAVPVDDEDEDDDEEDDEEGVLRVADVRRCLSYVLSKHMRSPVSLCEITHANPPPTRACA